ncbi:MAG TPA: hypothetical protein VFS09_12540, partial [Candidatus Eisenbacteria bacterium]|nr:hypothetical protein [Candidatus Eisenbacteria bacterium]
MEASVGTIGASSYGSVGANLGLPWCVAGAEYSGSTKDIHLVLSLRFPWRRGGLFRSGDLIRVDYHGGQEAILAGISFRSPFTRYHPNRPRRRNVTLPASTASLRAPPTSDSGLDTAVEKNLAAVEHSIAWMERMLTPRFDPNHFEKSAAGYRDHIRQPGHAYRDEDAAYHRSLDAAFTVAVGGDSTSGRAVAALAESILFRDVLVPFDREFGQAKSPKHAGGLCAQALPGFDERLASLLPTLGVSPAVRSAAPARCHEILRRVLLAVRRASEEAGDRWRNRYLLWCNEGALAWLPLNSGLRPEQYDTQQEWDSVLAAVAGEPFTEANTFEYLMMEQFHPGLKRMIRETRDYQVTIVHDFRGVNSSGSGDMYGWDLVVDGYMEAFARAIRELDEGERDHLPQFFLFLDDNYYEANGSRDIVSYLENLYHPSLPNLKPRAFRDQIDAAHDSLLAAVRNSSALKGIGEGRLRDLIKVHVNITNRFDPTFVLDVTHRDHRKMAFRDVSEADPAAGILLVTGQGIGEHYNGTGWEDRSLSLRGTALVEAKTAARNLFLRQGFNPEEVPDCLRPQPLPADYSERCARLRESGWTTPASILTNETGYGTKEASVLKTTIYNLAPPGSVILCYDSIWTSEFWAGMLVGAALRGSHEFPIGPTPP